jgi:MFS family permease
MRSWQSAIQGNVLAVSLVSLFTDFSSEMMNPLLPIFIAGLVGGAWAAFWVGLTEGLAETTASILKIFSGRISDKLGKRKLLVTIGYGLSTICRPLMVLAGTAWHVTALKFGDRVGKGIRTSPRDALIGDSVGPDVRGLAFSFHRAMDNLGAVLGPLTAIGTLYAFLHYSSWAASTTQDYQVSSDEMAALRWLFGLALIPGILAMAAVIFRVREIAPQTTRSTPSGRDAGNNAWKRLPRKFYTYIGIVAVFALGNSSDMFLLLYAWDIIKVPLVQLILLWVVFHISKVIFSIPGGALSDKVGRRPIIVIGWIVYALVYLGMAEAAAPWQFWALFIIYGIYYGMTEGVEKALVADFVPSADRGTAFGVYYGAVGVAALPASLVFGAFWVLIGPRLAFGIGAATAALASILLIALLSITRPQELRPSAE